MIRLRPNPRSNCRSFAAVSASTTGSLNITVCYPSNHVVADRQIDLCVHSWSRYLHRYCPICDPVLLRLQVTNTLGLATSPSCYGCFKASQECLRGCLRFIVPTGSPERVRAWLALRKCGPDI